MRKSATVITIVCFSALSYHQHQKNRSLEQGPAREPQFERELLQVDPRQSGVERQPRLNPPPMEESDLDREIRLIMEKGTPLGERKRQIPAIATSFARRTEPQRARRLAALCYLKTLGTPFMPIDIAEIALAETGDYGLSGKKVSHRGARGVWQVMPSRAKSHGYFPEEMENDQKCADAAVRELAAKLAMAHGNLTRAKKLYCGIGREADAYEVVRRQCRKEIMEELRNARPVPDDGTAMGGPPLPVYATLMNH
jgi:hypothetical protein